MKSEKERANEKIRQKAYYKTPRGLLTRIYGSQRTSSKQRGHPYPDYTKEELFHWMLNQGLMGLHTNWVSSGYQKELSPSVDRKDSTLPYTFENIRLVTWGTNNTAAYTERKTVRVTRQCSPVSQHTLEGDFVTSHVSISAACRSVGRKGRSSMLQAIRAKQPLWGYVWSND